MAAKDHEAAKAELGDAGNIEFYSVKAEDVIPDVARQLITDYASVPPEKVDDHVTAVRAKAFDIFPYPCIGMYRFLDLGLHQHTVYPEIIQRVQNGEHFLDLGCCFGQEIRKLIQDEAPAENLHGSDLRHEFVDLGYELFRDKEGEGGKINWHLANVFDDEDVAWKQLAGKISIIYTGSFFHLFDRDEQLAAAKRVVSLLKPEAGVLLLGRQVGNEEPGDFDASGYIGEKKRYRHNPQSWKELWDEVGEATGTKWKVDASFEDKELHVGGPEKELTDLRRERNMKRLKFVIRRI
jgi:SAM-dependent methyltransferase